MPWWAIAYLIILSVVILISIAKDFVDKRSLVYILGEFSSGAIGFLFIYSYWRDELSQLISWLVIPLLLYAIAWDQYALSKMKKSNYEDLSIEENLDMDRYSKLFAILFILPCYIAGALLSYRLIAV